MGAFDHVGSAVLKARHNILFAAVVLFAYGASCTGFREDEIECEQAIVHLSACCPSYDSNKISCQYQEHRDCNDKLVSTQTPDLTSDQSECLSAKSCEEIVAQGLCDLSGDKTGSACK